MKTLFEGLNFSQKDIENSSLNSILIKTKNDVNYFDTLCAYCSNNDIDIRRVSDVEFEECANAIENYSKAQRAIGIEKFFFWIDSDVTLNE